MCRPGRVVILPSSTQSYKVKPTQLQRAGGEIHLAGWATADVALRSATAVFSFSTCW
jgi:hypothetical protein